MPGFRESVRRQRAELERMLAQPMERLAARCAEVWPDRERLDEVLTEGLRALPYCTFLYALDREARQISDNIGHHGRMPEHYGRDRSGRPYLNRVVPVKGMILSDAYLSLRAHRPSITAVAVVERNGKILGFIGADFDLRDLPLTRRLYAEPTHWRQIKGDPAIRGGVFQQTRVESGLDRRIDDVLAILEELIVSHGVFHGKIHFSSNRATVWLLDDPYRYRLLTLEMLVDPNICLAFPRTDYPEDAVVPPEAIRPILEGFRRLRFADPTIYLRAGSVNVFNGMVALNFSCDGSHYLPWTEFLDSEHTFWQMV
ncbi:MAG: hypothetical protein D6721_04395 [Gammaproteobacteria bacterium]|nr:MAG: hypothetical protein D6721_04395 [Gammaproteobacteria bacterium]